MLGGGGGLRFFLIHHSSSLEMISIERSGAEGHFLCVSALSLSLSLSLSSISSTVCARASKIILPSCVTYGISNEKMCPSFLQVIAAEGEQKASRALREASEVIADTPSALQLRYLQVSHKTARGDFMPKWVDIPLCFLPFPSLSRISHRCHG